MNMLAKIDTGCSVQELIGYLVQLPSDAEVYIASNNYEICVEWEVEPIANATDLK